MTTKAEQLSQLKDFLSYISTFKGDLSNITAPPFVLSQKSATEFPASWCSHHDLFLAQSADEDPAKRALAVLKNFLCSLKTQTYTGSCEEDGAKKPLNPFLGELFLAEFGEGDGGGSRLISEQVSHHPPVTACYLYNEDHGISAEGYIAQSTTFSPTSGVTVKQIGHALIHLPRHSETHLITLPTLNVKNILTGSPYPELSGLCYITSTSGYTSRISFEGKRVMGMAGKKKNSFNAILYRNEEKEKILYEAAGQWNEQFLVRVPLTGENVETVHVETLEATPLRTKAVEEQDPWESRRAWDPVLKGIREGNIGLISEEKTRIEEAQRALRREEGQNGETWPRLFFRRAEKDQVAEELAKTVGESLCEEKTDGIWRFIGLEEAEKVTPPYHEGVLPTGRVNNQ